MELKIAVCDDSGIDREYIKKLLSAWCKKNGHIALTEEFPSGESFIFRHAEDKSFDILLLDIEMEGIDGVKTAESLRASDSRLKIVFTTGYPEFVSRGYDVAALHYLLKPITEEKLFPVLDRAAAELDSDSGALILQTDLGLVRLKHSDIIFAEVFSHSVHIATKNGTVEYSKPLCELENNLGQGFVRCHRSYLVNLGHIARLTKTEIILDGGKAIPLARNAAAEVHRKFIRYYTGEKL